MGSELHNWIRFDDSSLDSSSRNSDSVVNVVNITVIWVHIFIKAIKHCRKHLRLIPR